MLCKVQGIEEREWPCVLYVHLGPLRHASPPRAGGCRVRLHRDRVARHCGRLLGAADWDPHETFCGQSQRRAQLVRLPEAAVVALMDGPDGSRHRPPHAALVRRRHEQ